MTKAPSKTLDTAGSEIPDAPLTIWNVTPEFAALHNRFMELCNRVDQLIAEAKILGERGRNAGWWSEAAQVAAVLRQTFPPRPPTPPRVGAVALIADVFEPPPPGPAFVEKLPDGVLRASE